MTLPLERADGPTLFGGGWAQHGPRVGLQTAARTNRRRHAIRHATRLSTLVLADVAGVVGAMLLMVLVNPVAGFGQVVHRYDPTAGPISVMAQAVVAVCSGLFVLRAYEAGDADHDLRRVVLGAGLGLLVLYWAMLWQDGGTLLSAYLPAVAIFGGCIWGSRQLRQGVLRHVWPQSLEPARVLYVGSAHEIEAAMQRSPFRGAHAVAPIAQLDLARERAILGSDSDVIESLLQSSIRDHEIDTTLLCSQYTDDELCKIVVTAEAAGCRVISLSRTYAVARLSPMLKSYGGTPIVELTQPGIRGRDLVLKRAFDILVSSVLIVLLAPILAIVALLVRHSSSGPALFRQERVGYRGTPFHILKFRSMYADAEEQLESLRSGSIYSDARLFKMPDDPRVTPLGRFLRRSSLDELPQLFNVLGGTMSLVGPRPPLPLEVAAYNQHSFLRFDVKPGITGPWQVNGRNTVTSFDAVIALESAYVTGWTIWRDFVILARTVPVVLRMEGAH